MDRDTATAKANYCGPGIYGVYAQRPDDNTGNYVPYSLRTVSGFFNVPRSENNGSVINMEKAFQSQFLARSGDVVRHHLLWYPFFNITNRS